MSCDCLYCGGDGGEDDDSGMFALVLLVLKGEEEGETLNRFLDGLLINTLLFVDMILDAARIGGAGIPSSST